MRSRAGERTGRCTPCGLQLAASGYQEVINFSFVEPGWEADLAGMRRSDPAAQSDRQPALGHAHEPDRRTGGERALQPESQGAARAGVRDRPGVPAPAGRAGRARSMWRASGSRCAWRPPHSGRPPTSNGAWRTRPVDFFDVKGDLEALLAPLTARFEPAPHPALHPGRSARVILDGRGNRLDRRAASALAAEVRAAGAGGAVRGRCRAAAARAAARVPGGVHVSRRSPATCR